MFKVKIGKYVPYQIFSFTDLFAQSPSHVFCQIFRKKASTNLYVGIIVYNRISSHSAPVIIHFPFKHLPSKNPNGNPDKPLPISCNQTHTIPITQLEINGQ